MPKDEETTEDEANEKVVDESAPQIFPNLPPEDQDMQLEPVVFGPPAYGSPDPETANQTLLPLVDDPLATAEDMPEDYGSAEAEAAGVSATAAIAPEDRKAGDWKSMVEGAKNEDELESLRTEYDDSGADFTTVEEAFDKRESELEEGNA